jgi:hypothetical protein
MALVESGKHLLYDLFSSTVESNNTIVIIDCSCINLSVLRTVAAVIDDCQAFENAPVCIGFTKQGHDNYL